MLSKFLDPKNDFAFKRIFGTEKNKDILIHFLNDMLVFRDKKPIVDVTFLRPSQDPEIASQKTSIVDVLCQDEAGSTYIVEMQVAKTRGFEKRAQYYAAKAYINQMHKGEDYESLKEVIFLAIVDFTMFENKPSFKSDHVILDRDDHAHHLKDFSFTFLELGKFQKAKHELSSIIDKWAYFFKYADETREQDLPQIIGRDEVIFRAYEELNQFSWNKNELQTYEETMKRERDYDASMAYQYDVGVQDGLEKGLERGKEEGAYQERLLIAEKLLRNGMSLEKVAQLTSLQRKDIDSL